MKSLFINSLRWWVGTNLPDEHIFIHPSNRPKKLRDKIQIYFRKWIVHPIKRRLSKYYLILLKNVTDIKVIGITGSAGKTTTKEMLASILKTENKTVYSYANIDPIYNIPSTILRCNFKARFLVLEMGVEFPGEMDFYLWLAKPDIGVITNIYPTHLHFFGDADGVFREKSKLIRRLSEGSVAILNNSDKFLVKLKDSLKARTVWFGTGGEVISSQEQLQNDGRMKFLLIFDKDPKKSIWVEIPVVGSQFVDNALAAAAVAKNLGFSLENIKKGLETYEIPEHRMNIIKFKNGALLLDDSYNNNPAAAKYTLKTFQKIANKKNKIVIFGDMLELGKLERYYHLKLGKIIGKMNIDYLIGVGKASKTTVIEAGKILGREKVAWVIKKEMIMPLLVPRIQKNSIVLIKGSRSIGLDEVVSRLLRRFS